MGLMTLTQILNLVGRLDDTPGGDTPRERFRSFLEENVKAVGEARDYVDECLRMSGEQYNRALQDLANHMGRLLGFSVAFGRYQGIRGEIGYDGHWISPKGLHIVVEVKTTDVYAIKTNTLIGYIDALISEKKIPNWGHALGLYMLGRIEPEINQLENAIIAENRTKQLRFASLNSIISLADLMTEYDVSHDDIVAVIKPAGPRIDSIVDLISRIAAQGQSMESSTEAEEAPEQAEEGREVICWITPIKDDDVETTEKVLVKLIEKEGIYAFGERTPGRRYLKPGDLICFYVAGKGVVAHGLVISRPEHKPHHAVHDTERYPWVFGIKDVELYLDKPIVIDALLRTRLDSFKGRDASRGWSWFVQTTRRISRRDFDILTGSSTE